METRKNTCHRNSTPVPAREQAAGKAEMTHGQNEIIDILAEQGPQYNAEDTLYLLARSSRAI